MNFKYFFILFLFASINAQSQQKQSMPCDDGDRTYTKPEVAPVFGRKPEDLQNFFDTAFVNIKKSKGQLRVTFVVDSTGMVGDPSIYMNPSEIMDEISVRNVIKSMPRWKAGRAEDCDVKVVVMLDMEITKKSVIIKTKVP